MEIHDRTELRDLLEQRTGALSDVRLQSVRLEAGDPLVAELLRRDVSGMLVLGGELPAEVQRSLRDGGALILDANPLLPFDPFRGTLYTPDELYAGLDGGYQQTTDARCYHWSVETTSTRDVERAVYSGLHDVSVSDALQEAVDGLSTVAVLGGHAVRRDAPAYADAARLGARLAERHAVLTGGGPGAMEAVNLGASYAGRPTAELAAAVAHVRGAAGLDDVTRWARTGLDVRERTAPGTARSLGIPTWHYGHEPPNVFAGLIAKYFSNALREDTLLALANHALVVLPGAAGTVQEIFQASVRNYYSTSEHLRTVLVGREHWTAALPAWPLLRALAADRPMAAYLHLVDSVDEAAELILGATPLT